MRTLIFLAGCFIALLCVKYANLRDRTETIEARIDSITVILGEIAEVMPDQYTKNKLSLIETAMYDLRPGCPCLEKTCNALREQDSLKALGYFKKKEE